MGQAAMARARMMGYSTTPQGKSLTDRDRDAIKERRKRERQAKKKNRKRR
jgi:signal recognition particle subunit SRP54